MSMSIYISLKFLKYINEKKLKDFYTQVCEQGIFPLIHKFRIVSKTNPILANNYPQSCLLLESYGSTNVVG